MSRFWIHKQIYVIVRGDLRKWLLLLSHFSCVRLCATPQTAAHQAPPSLGFSTQEHWNGLSFPSPMHESEKWKWSHSVMSDPQQPHGLQLSRLLPPWDFPGKSTGVGCHRLLRYTYMYIPSLLNLPPILNLIPLKWGKEGCGRVCPSLFTWSLTCLCILLS